MSQTNPPKPNEEVKTFAQYILLQSGEEHENEYTLSMAEFSVIHRMLNDLASTVHSQQQHFKEVCIAQNEHIAELEDRLLHLESNIHNSI